MKFKTKISISMWHPVMAFKLFFILALPYVGFTLGDSNCAPESCQTLEPAELQTCLSLGHCSHLDGSDYSSLRGQTIQHRPNGALLDFDLSVKEQIFCDDCKVSTHVLLQLSKNVTFKHHISTKLEYVCELVPKNMQGVCMVMVSKNKAQIHSLVSKRNEPTKICETIKYCPEKGYISPPLPPPPSKSRPQSHLHPHPHPHSHPHPQPQKKPEINFSKDKKGTTHEEKSKGIDEDDFEYKDKESKEYKNKNKKKTKIFSISSSNKLGKFFKVNGTKKSNTKKEHPLCAPCLKTLSYIDTSLPRSAAEKNIVSQLSKSCKTVMKKEQKSCYSSFSENKKKMVSLLYANNSIDQACTKLKFCNLKKALRRSDAEDTKCNVCIRAVTFLYEMTGGEESSVEDIVQVFCSYFPDPMQGSCENFMQEQSPRIIQKMKRKESELSICNSIRYCQNYKKRDESQDFDAMRRLTKFQTKEFKDRFMSK